MDFKLSCTISVYVVSHACRFINAVPCQSYKVIARPRLEALSSGGWYFTGHQAAIFERKPLDDQFLSTRLVYCHFFSAGISSKQKAFSRLLGIDLLQWSLLITEACTHFNL